MQKESIYDQMTSSEKEVARFLKNIGIYWSYEHPIFVWDENNRPRVWAPDFYLVSFGIYVEVCGSAKFDYDYRKNIYKENGYDVIFLHIYKKSSRWKKYFMRYLKRLLNYRNKKLISMYCNYI